MALESDADRDALRARLAGITRPVTILFFTQGVAPPETVDSARQALAELLSLSDQLVLEDVNVGAERARTARYGIEHTPAIVLLAAGTDSRIRFLGAAAGYEFQSLVEALVLAGTGMSGLTPASKALIAQQVTDEMQVKVFVTPTCAHCPRAVSLAHRMAIESPLITATCVEASAFIDLARKYRVTGVPKTVVNDSIEIFGALPEEEFVRAVLGLSEAS